MTSKAPLKTPWPSEAEVAEAVALLRAGEVIGLPTETVYGLAADATNPEAVAKIFRIKGRPSGHPLIAHVGQKAELSQLVIEVSPAAERLVEAFWPGPLTLILKRSVRAIDAVTGGLDTVAVRMPSHPVALQVLRALGRPLAAPSANRFGAVSPTTRAHVLRDLGAEVPLVLEGGACEVGLESTILDLSGAAPRLLRPGAVTREQLARVLGEAVLDSDGLGPAAPGTLESHYAPRAEVELVSADEIFVRARVLALEGLVGVIAQSEPPRDLPSSVLVRVRSGGANAYAHELYADLRFLDEAGAPVILSEVPSAGGLGEATLDRLTRAAAPRK